jgi:hypothetical protein
MCQFKLTHCGECLKLAKLIKTPLDKPMQNASSPGPYHCFYSEAESLRRDSNVWTLIQGILVAVRFLVFLVRLRQTPDQAQPVALANTASADAPTSGARTWNVPAEQERAVFFVRSKARRNAEGVLHAVAAFH